MKLSPQPISGRAIDLGYLSALVTITAAGILAAGMATSFSNVQGTGVGLSNIRQRLEAIHENRAWLDVEALANGGFSASIVVPVPKGGYAQTEFET
jgi:hypothetical protein